MNKINVIYLQNKGQKYIFCSLSGGILFLGDASWQKQLIFKWGVRALSSCGRVIVSCGSFDYWLERKLSWQCPAVLQEAFQGKKSWENAEVNCERQRAAPLKSTYLKCYSERRLVSNLPKNTSRCKGSLMSFSHCVLPHLKIIRNQLLGCTLTAPARRLRWQITGVTGIQLSTLKLLWIHHPGNCSTLLFTGADTCPVMHGGASGVGGRGGTRTHTCTYIHLHSSILPQP